MNKGNVLDLEHFSDTYTQVKSGLKKGSLIIFDKGANTTDNIKSIQDSEMDYLTSMKLNTSDDKIIEKFDPERAELRALCMPRLPLSRPHGSEPSGKKSYIFTSPTGSAGTLVSVLDLDKTAVTRTKGGSPYTGPHARPHMGEPAVLMFLSERY